MDLTAFREQAKTVPKFAYPGDDRIAHEIGLAFGIASCIGFDVSKGARVLDLGCGIGDSVRLLLSRGFDAYGVDIGEWWGHDHDAYWQDVAIPHDDVTRRLSVTDERDYRLPYADNTFDFAMSSQVFEHVFNYKDVFRELGRVLKPGAISVNVFPGRGTPFEPHLGIPLTALSHHKTWIAAWAMVCRKNRKTWSEEYRFLRSSMASNNYPSRRQLVRYGHAAGVKIRFAEGEYIECSNSRPTRIASTAERLHIGWAVRPVLERLCQRAMIVSKQ